MLRRQVVEESLCVCTVAEHSAASHPSVLASHCYEPREQTLRARMRLPARTLPQLSVCLLKAQQLDCQSWPKVKCLAGLKYIANVTQTFEAAPPTVCKQLLWLFPVCCSVSRSEQSESSYEIYITFGRGCLAFCVLNFDFKEKTEVNYKHPITVSERAN